MSFEGVSAEDFLSALFDSGVIGEQRGESGLFGEFFFFAFFVDWHNCLIRHQKIILGNHPKWILDHFIRHVCNFIDR